MWQDEAADTQVGDGIGDKGQTDFKQLEEAFHKEASKAIRKHLLFLHFSFQCLLQENQYQRYKQKDNGKYRIGDDADSAQQLISASSNQGNIEDKSGNPVLWKEQLAVVFVFDLQIQIDADTDYD